MLQIWCLLALVTRLPLCLWIKVLVNFFIKCVNFWTINFSVGLDGDFAHKKGIILLGAFIMRISVRILILRCQKVQTDQTVSSSTKTFHGVLWNSEILDHGSHPGNLLKYVETELFAKGKEKCQSLSPSKQEVKIVVHKNSWQCICQNRWRKMSLFE